MTHAELESVARELYDASPDVFWNPHSETRGHRHWGDLTEARREHFRSLANTRSLPQAGEGVVEMVAKALHNEAQVLGETGSRRPWGKITDEEREGFHALARAAISALPPAGRVEEMREALDYEELSIIRGQQVVITFKNSTAAFDLFNELRARTALTGKGHP